MNDSKTKDIKEFLPRENCPYCGGEMISGKIRGDGRSGVKFLRDDAPGDFLSKLDRALWSGAVTAAEFTMLGTCFFINARFCEKCRKMIFSTDVTS